MTIYGYLRVSSDDQIVNNQREGVEAFASDKGWTIDEYITDEGVSGGKDPSKRNLGPLLKKIKKGDVIIASEISRLGRDLYMVMDILHYAMQTGCKIYTVKDRFELGDDIQSKVLAFAFGLAAEIERQMIRQRTQEALRLRVKMGVLLGRPLGAKTTIDTAALKVFKEHKTEIDTALRYGTSIRSIASVLGINRNTVARFLEQDGWYERQGRLVNYTKKLTKPRPIANYKDEPYCVVDLPRDVVTDLILKGLTIPEIHERLSDYSYEEVYDTILIDDEWHKLYRERGHKTAKSKFFRNGVLKK